MADRFTWNGDRFLWGTDSFQWEVTTDSIDRSILTTHWLLEFIGRDYNIWSGDDNLEYNGKTYQGAGQFISLSQAEIVVDEPNNRITVTIAANTNEILGRLITDNRIYEVEILWIVSVDRGITYEFSGRRFRGRTNNPTYRNGLYVVELEPHICENRGRPRKWSDEDQRVEYPHDRGFAFASDLIDGVKRARWPQ